MLIIQIAVLVVIIILSCFIYYQTNINSYTAQCINEIVNIMKKERGE